MNHPALASYAAQFVALDKKEEQAFLAAFEYKRLRKKQFLVQPDFVNQHRSFVLKGAFRSYIVTETGEEKTLQFAIENWWIGDIGSFHAETPSRLYIEAMEDSLLLQVSKNDQLELFTRFPKFNQIFRVFTENALVAAQRRILQNIGSTAEERYLDFAQRYPQLFNRISNVQIASYLGVTPEFLSTIRKRIVQK